MNINRFSLRKWFLIIIITFRAAFRKMHGKFNHDVLLMLQILNASLVSNDVVEDFGNHTTPASHKILMQNKKDGYQ
jgi:hypothetical protein